MRQRFTRWLSFLAVFCMLAAYGSGAQAALQAVGPTDLITTIPTWYQDPNSLSLAPCLDQNGFCILPAPFSPLTPPVTAITTTGPISNTNFPVEIFYFLADSKMAVNGDTAVLRLALEAAFLGGVAPNTGITFLRVNLQRMKLTPSSTFTVTHPYGTFQFTTDATGNTPAINGQAFRLQDPLAPTNGVYFPPDLQAATTTHIGPFLRGTAGLIIDPISGNTYLGNPAVTTTVTGSPFGTNFFRIDGPNIGGAGINTIQTTAFNLSGRVFTGQIPTPVTLDRTTYARDPATGQVDLFVTALPTAAAKLVVSGTNIAPTTMVEDIPNSGKFFAHIPFTTTLPTGVVVTNNLDVPPVVHPVTLVDEVNITEANYDPATNNLTIKAASRDKVAPLPTLTVPAFAAPNVLDATGTLVVSLATTIPPEFVTVASSKGGSATVPVSVVTPPPVANNDIAVVATGNSVVINVLANDSATTPATLNVTTVAPSLATRGTVSAPDPVTGAVTYTPTGLTAGTDSFTYTVTDSNLHVSNTATVTIEILAQGTPPVAVDDTTATTLTGSVVTINVIANDTPLATINPASLLLTTPTGGTAVANPNGTVTYTAPATAGIYDFAYTVKDTALLPATSNPATVKVTVTAPNVPPVAVNDTATTSVGSTITINLVANDTSATSTINPATVAVTQPAAGGGSVGLPSATGTVSYTAPAVAGTYTFTYTVKDNFAPAATSNIATVTVTVAAAASIPVAVNDAAATVPNGIITINLVANDTSASSTINPGSVTIVTPPGLGQGTLNGLPSPTGTVSYTAPALAGTYTFTYTVKDILGATSLPGTVTVTVTSITIPPVANNDTAATTTGSTITINLVANDTSATSTINPATVAIVTPPGLGQGTLNGLPSPTGTVSYTAPGVAGAYTFTYTVKDNSVTPATSNVATVTVTVTAPSVPPVANPEGPFNMTAGAGANTIIPVLANDIFSAPATALNPASVTIATPPANGTATVNLTTGAITYTPTAGFVGTNTISYTVRDNLGLLSNIATDTVNVAAAVSNEVLAVTLAQYLVAGKEWKVEGTTNFRVAGETVSIYNNATTPGTPAELIGTAPVVTGVWKFGFKPSLIAPNALNKISVQSNQTPAGVLAGVTVTVR
jgi:hypothetical protein